MHGYTWDDLRGKPKFATIVHELLAFLVGAGVVIHNAPFDVSFLNTNLRACAYRRYQAWIWSLLTPSR